MKQRRIFSKAMALVAIFLLLCPFMSMDQWANAQNPDGQGPNAPRLTHAMTLHVKCSAARQLGSTAMGKRVIIPIIGGTFEGKNDKNEAFKGEVLAGGADYQLVDTTHNNRTRLEAIYTIKTSDGILIHVRNVGILANPRLSDGTQGFYFNTTPVFEAPMDSKYAWLNDAIFVCTPFFEKDAIGLKVWKVN